MLYATYVNSQGKLVTTSGHISDRNLYTILDEFSETTREIQADGDELLRCCEILDRNFPPCRVYKFRGHNAQEIAANWYP